MKGLLKWTEEPLKIMLKIAASRVCRSGSDEISLLFPRSRALLCFHSTLSAYEAKLKWWWEGNSGNHSGPDQAPAKWRLARRLPVILISPAFTRARIEINPLLFGPTARLPETFSQLWSNRQSTKGTRCFTDTHLPLPLSPGHARLPKSRAEIMPIFCSLVEIFCRCSLSPCTSFYFIFVFRCRQSCMEEPCRSKAFVLYIYFWFTWR